MAQPAPSTLPLEIEREIFEQAAYTDPLCVPKLMLVAWRVKIWVEPFLYRILMLEDTTWDTTAKCYPLVDDPGLSRASTIPPHIFKNSVRNLWLNWLPHDVAEYFISAATGVENLWVSIRFNPTGSLLHAIGSVSPKRLHTYLHDLLALEDLLTLPILSRLTHIEVLSASTDKHAEIWQVVAQIRTLTHLAFHEDDSEFLDLCPSLLGACTTLRVLLYITDPHDFESGEDFPVLCDLREDLRFVQMRHEDDARDWRTGALTGVDFWSRADDFIAKHQSGEINKLQYVMEEDSTKE
ncbi:hypothetical protein FB45DRAFT_1066314 [Roridomyces roridus]|uniref:Uncharacterized protein n=1 Tax=Roridomyces roridus TaxID=1738132 RepID=A0AAD7B4X9_9AGAR|nr:hypothetical protein FB45DRAFT_1066314 [Roridomyces roridus]